METKFRNVSVGRWFKEPSGALYQKTSDERAVGYVQSVEGGPYDTRIHPNMDSRFEPSEKVLPVEVKVSIQVI